jgi:hypothetical protein
MSKIIYYFWGLRVETIRKKNTIWTQNDMLKYRTLKYATKDSICYIVTLIVYSVIKIFGLTRWLSKSNKID